MDYLWGTNILIHYLRNSSLYLSLNSQYKFETPENRVLISVVSLGEIYSLAIQLNWGLARQQKLNQALDKVKSVPISLREIIRAYASIDAFSQGKHAMYPLPEKMSARNMGKNDLWLAATANVLGAPLVSTDHDFDHLKETFIDLMVPT